MSSVWVCPLFPLGSVMARPVRQEWHRRDVVSFLLHPTERHTMSVYPTAGDDFAHLAEVASAPVGFSEQANVSSFHPPVGAATENVWLNWDSVFAKWCLSNSTVLSKYIKWCPALRKGLPSPLLSPSPHLFTGLFVSVTDSCFIQWNVLCYHHHLFSGSVSDLTHGIFHFVLNLSFFQGFLKWVSNITFVFINGKTTFQNWELLGLVEIPVQQERPLVD